MTLDTLDPFLISSTGVIDRPYPMKISTCGAVIFWKKQPKASSRTLVHHLSLLWRMIRLSPSSREIRRANTFQYHAETAEVAAQWGAGEAVCEWLLKLAIDAGVETQTIHPSICGR